MHVRPDWIDEDVDVSVDAGVELTNALGEGGGRETIRTILVERSFLGAAQADDAEIDEVIHRFGPISGIFAALPELAIDRAVARINDELAAYNVSPSLVAHDGAPLHIHWTTPHATFGHRVVVDVLMGLGQTLCNDGLSRIGRCSAEGCDRLFHDTSRNRSRRFCSDPRCASRTHTARHRARRRTG